LVREVVLNRTRVGRYFRTTVPSEVRKFLGIGEGDVVEWVFNDSMILVRKASR